MENIDMFFLNCVTFLLTGWAVIFINRNFVYKTKINKRRFKLFELRDRLTLMAMRGEVDYYSQEYQFLLKILNSLIRVTGDFQIVDFLKFLVQTQDSEAIQKEFRAVRRSIEAKEDGLNEIWIECSRVMAKIMGRHLRLFVMIAISLAGLLQSIRVCKAFAKQVLKTGHKIQMSRKTIEELAHCEVRS